MLVVAGQVRQQVHHGWAVGLEESGQSSGTAVGAVGLECLDRGTCDDAQVFAAGVGAQEAAGAPAFGRLAYICQPRVGPPDVATPSGVPLANAPEEQFADLGMNSIGADDEVERPCGAVVETDLNKAPRLGQTDDADTVTHLDPVEGSPQHAEKVSAGDDAEVAVAGDAAGERRPGEKLAGGPSAA